VRDPLLSIENPANASGDRARSLAGRDLPRPPAIVNGNYVRIESASMTAETAMLSTTVALACFFPGIFLDRAATAILLFGRVFFRVTRIHTLLGAWATWQI